MFTESTKRENQWGIKKIHTHHHLKSLFKKGDTPSPKKKSDAGDAPDLIRFRIQEDGQTSPTLKLSQESFLKVMESPDEMMRHFLDEE